MKMKSRTLTIEMHQYGDGRWHAAMQCGDESVSSYAEWTAQRAVTDLMNEINSRVFRKELDAKYNFAPGACEVDE